MDGYAIFVCVCLCQFSCGLQHIVGQANSLRAFGIVPDRGIFQRGVDIF